MKINKDRFLGNLHYFRTLTDTPGEGVTRFSYGVQDAKLRSFLIDRVTRLGCSVSVDALQNIRVALPGNVPGRRTVIAGSHIDTVRNGGWLDGIYGTSSALEVLESLAECDKAVSDSFKYNYELVIFAEEEGSNFGSTLTGSKFLTGRYTESALDKLKDADGRTLRQVLEAFEDIKEAAAAEENPLESTASHSAIDVSNIQWDFDQIKTMLELHIEQGPVLERAGLSLGIVDSIFGMRVIDVKLTGVGNHAGATPMAERFDALCTASECVLAAESIVKSDPDKRTVVTVGRLDVKPDCSNVIPETVDFSLEVRDKDNDKINSYMDSIIARIREIATARHVECEINEHAFSEALHLNDRVIDSMKELAEAEKLPYMVMDSGAVHDACMIAAYADTGMIFVPSKGGRSHVPEEDTDESDLVLGAQFLMDTVLKELTQ